MVNCITVKSSPCCSLSPVPALLDPVLASLVLSLSPHSLTMNRSYSRTPRLASCNRPTVGVNGREETVMGGIEETGPVEIEETALGEIGETSPGEMGETDPGEIGEMAPWEMNIVMQ